MKRTQNYQLCQWEKTDRIKMENFNADNEKVDAALAAVNERVDAVDALCKTFGNAQVYVTTYVGTGGVNGNVPPTITCPFQPDVVLVAGYKGYSTMLIHGVNQAKIVCLSNVHATVTWNGNTVSWHGVNAEESLNQAGQTYYAVAIGHKS